jgi:hypothetical protein
MLNNMKVRLAILFLIMILCFLTGSVTGQDTREVADTSRRAAVKVYLDCSSCDMNYTRQEIPFINYVRDVHEAQLFILVTDQESGSGGRQYTYTFHGQANFKGMEDTLTYTSNPDQMEALIREERTNLLKMGLMRYVAKTPLRDKIEINHSEELEGEEVIDRWNYWVFSLSTEPQFGSEEENKELDLRNSINISRVTPELKLEMEMDHFFEMEKFIENVNTDSAETNTYSKSETSFDNLIVKSLGEHWSAGLRLDLGSSTRENYNFITRFLPSVEYDIYPYSESTHRQLRIMYSSGYQYNNYIDSTVNNKLSENLYLHELNIAYQVQKKWGSINVALTGSNYFHDFSKHRIELNSSINLRIFKGLSLQFYGGVAYLSDQINLKKKEIDEAERYLDLRELQTTYRVQSGIELTYTFGSIYNNVVNPRFNPPHFHFD